jgi:GntR family transcriptional regulator / MocR family aminotransferase
MELSILVEGGRNLSAQIYHEIRRAMLEGRLRTGERLPASRELARQLSLSRNTVLAAYDRLVSEGYLQSTGGSGTFVAHILAGRDGHHQTARTSKPPELSGFARRLACPRAIVPRRDLPYDFRPGVPEIAHFPISAWRRITAQHLHRLSITVAYYGDPAGHQGLREAIHRHFSHSRALRCTADDIIVVNGSQQALDLVGRVLIEPGDVVAFEDPGYPAALAVFNALGARIVPVPVDVEGIRTDLLPDEAKLVYVTPSHQFPLGVPLTLHRRRELLDWASRRRAIIVEDDYDSEFRYGGRPLDALQGLDQSGTVVYLGTFSKVLFPGLRLGYMVAPAPLREPLVAAKWIADRHTESLEQHVMADFIDDGHFARYIRRMQRIYAERHGALLDALGRWLPWVTPLPAVAGLHLTAMLPERCPADEFIARAAATGVGLYAISPFRQKAGRPALMFGFGGCGIADIPEGIRRVANLSRAMGITGH